MPDDDKHPLDEHIAALKKAMDTAASFKERFPAAALDALGTPDKGPKMDSAWSNPDNQYKMGVALRAKAAQGK